MAASKTESFPETKSETFGIATTLGKIPIPTIFFAVRVSVAFDANPGASAAGQGETHRLPGGAAGRLAARQSAFYVIELHRKIFRRRERAAADQKGDRFGVEFFPFGLTVSPSSPNRSASMP